MLLDKMMLKVSLMNNKPHVFTEIPMQKLAFIKHLAVAGMGFEPRWTKFMRFLGSMLLYSPYMRKFSEGHFDDPFQDPTEKGQFSNIAGKAIADFLSKRIDQSIMTVNYESALKILRLPVQGERPDLIAFRGSPPYRFTIEAKGYTRGPGNMQQHKKQSRSGLLKAQFSRASVAYNMYNGIKVNYWDPENENFNDEGNIKLFSLLSKKYYTGFLSFLNYGEKVDEFIYKGEKFWAVIPWNKHEIWNKWQAECIYYCLQKYRIEVILPKEIEKYASEGLPHGIEPFGNEIEEGNLLYIDNDRIGLRIFPNFKGQ